jgi:hypothetical protein
MKLIEVNTTATRTTLEQYLVKTPDLHISPGNHGILNIYSFGNCSKVKALSLKMSGQPISNLEGCPRIISGSASFSGCTNLKSLHNIHQHISYARDLEINDDVTNVLGILYVEGLEALRGWPGIGRSVQEMKFGWGPIVWNHYIGDKDIHACQEDLLEAGFIKQAKL